MNPDDAEDLAAAEPREPLRTVEVILDGSGRGTIVVDGDEVHRVSAVAIDADAHERPTAELRFTVADRVRFLGAARVDVDADTAAALRLLGWTPPAAERTEVEQQEHVAARLTRARAVAQALVDRALVTLVAGDRDLDDDPGHPTGGHP